MFTSFFRLFHIDLSPAAAGRGAGVAGALALTALLASPAALAGCSRPIVVPVTPMGVSVIVRDDDVSGVFPEMLEQFGAKAGCHFVWKVVPRARLEVMFEEGRADLLVAATQSDKRDQSGIFIPQVITRASLVSVEKGQVPINSMAQLLTQTRLRVALVRGFDYGPAYQELSRALGQQKRLFLEPDVISVARLLEAGMADVTILPSTAVYGASATDERLLGLQKRLRVEALEELPWTKGGIYVSTKSLPEADRALLEQLLLHAARTGALYKGYQRYFPPHIMSSSTRPL